MPLYLTYVLAELGRRDKNLGKRIFYILFPDDLIVKFATTLYAHRCERTRFPSIILARFNINMLVTRNYTNGEHALVVSVKHARACVCVCRICTRVTLSEGADRAITISAEYITYMSWKIAILYLDSRDV